MFKANVEKNKKIFLGFHGLESMVYNTVITYKYFL